ncbi:MAG: hypothetical protein ACQEXJ_03510 [Myxococcota bacterium]
MTHRLAAAILLGPVALAGCTKTGDSVFMPLDVDAAPGDVPGDPGGDTRPPAPTWEDDIQPLLADKGCGAALCHGDNTASGLSVASVEALEEGGDHGPAVVPCQPGDGTILGKLSSTPPFGGRMPIGGPFLTEAEMDLVESWIASGARVSVGDPGCDG